MEINRPTQQVLYIYVNRPFPNNILSCGSFMQHHCELTLPCISIFMRREPWKQASMATLVFASSKISQTVGHKQFTLRTVALDRCLLTFNTVMFVYIKLVAVVTVFIFKNLEWPEKTLLSEGSIWQMHVSTNDTTSSTSTVRFFTIPNHGLSVRPCREIVARFLQGYRLTGLQMVELISWLTW